MPASDRTSPNPGARLHPHVPRGPGGLKTFALIIDPKKMTWKKPNNSNSIAMNPKPSSKADILCSGPGGLKTFALMIAPKKDLEKAT